MTTLVQTGLLTSLLRRLPSRVLAMLDAWSHRVAMRRAQERREACRQRAQSLGRQRTGA